MHMSPQAYVLAPRILTVQSAHTFLPSGPTSAALAGVGAAPADACTTPLSVCARIRA